MGGQRFSSRLELHKVSGGLGILFGFAAICTKNGEPYFDEGSSKSAAHEHLPEDVMLKAAAALMRNSRVSTDEHERDEDGNPVHDGDVIFAFPLTAEIAKDLGIETTRTGLLVGVKPSARTLAKVNAGEITGFSIGGYYGEVEEVA